MTVNTEWLDARDTAVRYAVHVDDGGIQSNGPALLLSMDEVVAIEGSRDELIQFALRIIETLTKEN